MCYLQALIRDGFKCIVSGIYDDNALKLEIPSIDKEVVRQEGTVFTECVHIVPQSTYFDVSTSPDKEDYSASLLAVLERFGYNVDSLNGTKVHSLHNVMTMQHDVYDWFDRLKLWFEATSIPHCYHVKAASGYFPATARKKTITFVTSDSELSLPSPELLALHAACAKVAHLSGAAAYIDKLDRDTDDLCVLAHDGGSSSILNNALLRSLSSTINAGA
ncbi:hypothetical protein MPER_11531 [Moniliophthora perniciosa FA553]|nr:hypothetical protein MPER_11531 [Moniliophthora perniciosa FA553]